MPRIVATVHIAAAANPRLGSASVFDGSYGFVFKVVAGFVYESRERIKLQSGNGGDHRCTANVVSICENAMRCFV